jgi:hypothetical protein
MPMPMWSSSIRQQRAAAVPPCHLGPRAHSAAAAQRPHERRINRVNLQIRITYRKKQIKKRLDNYLLELAQVAPCSNL